MTVSILLVSVQLSILLAQHVSQNAAVGSGPATIQMVPGQPLPTRTWIERRMPAGTIRSYMQTGGKHGRAFYHPGLKSMIFAGGDWETTQPQYEGGSGVGSEIWALDVVSDKWTLLRPFCVPGEIQPGGPDTVGWAYDSKRDRGLMTPGFYNITQGAQSPCGAIYGWGGYAFAFDTRRFTGPDALAGLPRPPGGWGGDEGAAYGLYNPALDEYVRVRNAPTLERLNLSAGTWTVQKLSNRKPDWNPIPNRAQLVIDVRDQCVYWIDSPGRKVIKVRLKNASVTQIPLPPQYVAPPEDHEIYLVFDPGNRVLMVPNNRDMGESTLNGLGIYHVDTGRWEWEAVPAAVVGSVWGFDGATGAMIGIGKRSQPFAYFLYNYTPGPR